MRTVGEGFEVALRQAQAGQSRTRRRPIGRDYYAAEDAECEKKKVRWWEKGRS